jgi:hypothetical protein
MAHKGKATSDVNYNLGEAYSNPSIHSCLSDYTAMAREIHGLDYNPSTHDLNGEIVMRVGGGKKHGKFWIGDGVLDTASTTTLSEIRARSTSESPTICPRPSVAQGWVDALEVISVLFIVH